MSTLLIKNIDTLVTCDRNNSVLRDASLFCDNGIITMLDASPMQCADEIIDGSHMIAYPGLINTHHHFYQSFTRNLPQVQGMELFDWLKALYGIWKYLDDDVVRYSALTAMGEMAKYGCTTCADHHYVFPQTAGDRLIDAQIEASSMLGVRITATRGSMSLSEKDGGLPPDSVVQELDPILKDSERLIDTWHDPSHGSMVQIALAPCSPFSVTAELLRQSALLARSKGVRLHTHLCETKDEERFTLEATGMRPFDYMESLGWTGSDVWFAHGIHFNDSELKRLGETRTGVAHCPASNMKLSSGVARIPEMLELGVPVGLALDGSASNDGNSLLEELRIAYLLHRLTWGERAPSGGEILKLATNGSATVLGRDDIGSLEPGKCADLFLVDTRRIELVGALGDPAALPATVGLKRPVDYTIVSGRVVVRDGRLALVDEGAIAAKASAVCDAFLKRTL